MFSVFYAFSFVSLLDPLVDFLNSSFILVILQIHLGIYVSKPFVLLFSFYRLNYLENQLLSLILLFCSEYCCAYFWQVILSAGIFGRAICKQCHTIRCYLSCWRFLLIFALNHSLVVLFPDVGVLCICLVSLISSNVGAPLRTL